MRPILIAECCQNHNGKRDVLERMIHAAAENGADYVKIQSIRSAELTRRERFEEGVVDAAGNRTAIKRPFAPEAERLAGLDLDLATEAWFVETCWKAGVAPLTTVFTRGVVEEIKDLGFEAIKIASYDCRSYPLLRDVKRYWKTIFVSTGATLDAEIARAAAELEGTDLTFLHCVTLYPTPREDLHLRRIAWLRRFATKVGYSDHTSPSADGLFASKAAMALDAACIERHFTVLGPTESRDGPVSVNAAQLRELRRFADLPRTARVAELAAEYPDWAQALGKATRALSPAEWLNRDYYAGRFASRFRGRELFNWEDVELSAASQEPK